LGVGDVTFVEDIQGYAMQVKDFAQQIQAYKAQLDQIQNQIKGLAYMAANAKKLPTSLVSELTSSIRDYNAILQAASGLSYKVNAASAQFQQLYTLPATMQGNITGLSALWTGQVKSAALSAIKTQAITDKLDLQQERLAEALSFSDNAEGAMQVQQASNQMLGLIADQQASMLELQAAATRVQTSIAAQQATREEAGRKVVDEWLGGTLPTYYESGQTSGGLDLPRLR
jgi:P-type conjugative transfer protein TrbJ